MLTHLAAGRDEALHHVVKAGAVVVQAEDHAPAADPAQQQAMRAQVELQHPVITPRLRVQHGPDGRHIRYAQRQLLLRQPLVQLCGARVPARVQALVQRSDLRPIKVVKKGRHAAHHIGVRVEGAARQAHVSRAIFAVALHQRVGAAHDAHRQPAAQRLAVGDHVGTHAEVGLGATGCEPKADKDLVEDEHDAALGADLAQRAQPRGVGSAVEVRAAAAVHELCVGRRVGVGMQGLERVDQHAGDVAPRAQHLQRTLVHVAQRVGLARRQWVARPGLHVFPPAVVGAAKAHEVLAPRVVARQAHGLHHGFGARHVKRDFVQARDGLEPRDVGQHLGVQLAKHHTECARACRTFVDAGFVELVAKEIHAIRAGEVDEALAVQVFHHHAVAALHEGAQAQRLAHQRRIGERHAVAAGELQVRKRLARQLGEGQRVRRALRKQGTQLLEAGASLCGDVRRRAVAVEEACVVVGIARHQGRQAFGNFRVASQRAVLGARQRDAPPRRRRDGQGREHQGGQGQKGQGFFHAAGYSGAN